ncbi:MAG TPA: WYL domain-containing transcriptional regulator [Bacillota bacterium]|nr:WYL domain-containing transcriptional regulator [Bacillota bacterium]
MPNPYANLSKLIQAVSLLAAPGGATIRTIMSRLGISRRSAFRMLEALTDLGVPLVDERRDLSTEKVYRLLADYAHQLPNLALPSFDLNSQERTFLDAILEGRSLQASSSAALLSSLRAKLDVLLPDLDPDPDTNPTASLLETFRTAIRTSQACSVVYRSPVDSIARSYTLYPVKLLEHRGGLYLYAKPEGQTQCRLLDLDLFESATLAATSSEHPVDIDYAASLAATFDLEADAPIQAVIRFSSTVAMQATARHIGILQSTKPQPDGSVILTLGSRNLRDLIRWSLSYGPDAEILAPPELRSMTRKELAQALARYDSTCPPRV